MPFCTLAYFSVSPYSCTPLAIVLSSLFLHTWDSNPRHFQLGFTHIYWSAKVSYCVLFCMTVTQTEYVSLEPLVDRKQFCEFLVRVTDLKEQSSGRRYVRPWQVDWLQTRQAGWQKGVQTGRPARAVWPRVSRHKDNKDKWLMFKYKKQEFKNCGRGEGCEGKHHD